MPQGKTPFLWQFARNGPSVTSINKNPLEDVGMNKPVSRLNAHGRTTFIKLADHLPDADVAQFGPITAVRTGVPVPIYNRVFTFEAPPHDELERAVTWMADRDLPFWVTVTKPLVQDVGDQFAELDLVKVEDVNPGMVMSSLAEIPPTETSADITEVTDSDLLDEFIGVFATVFDVPIEIARQVNPASLLDDAEIRMFVGQVDGETVACGRLVRTDDVAGVYGIGVDEGFRRRGIGEAMTWTVLRAGQDDGCKIGGLQSSQMAYSLYQRMGFDTVVTYHHFAPSALEPAEVDK